MRRAVWRAGGAACLCVLAACATSPPPRIAYHPEAHPGVRRIVIVDAGPTRLGFTSSATQGIAQAMSGHFLSLVALTPVLLVALGADKLLEEELNVRVQSVPFDYGDALAEALAVRLTAGGYDVARVSVPRPGSSDGRGWIDDYRGWIGAGDAVLDVAAPHAGYTAISAWEDYRPVAVVCVRMVLPSQRRIALRECYWHGLSLPQYDTFQITTNGLPGFASWDELIAVPAKTADGLRRSAKAIAEHIASDLGP